MIAGSSITERQYRRMEALSQSMLKDFCEDRKKFYKKYIAKERMKEDISQASKMGNLVDCLLLTRETFEDKFFMSICTKIPTGLMLDFCEALATHTIAATDEHGVVQRPFQEMAADAYRDSGFKWDITRVLADFSTKDPERYYSEIIATSVTGKIVVMAKDVENAEKIVTALRTGQFTAPILNNKDDKIDMYQQLAVTDFIVAGRPCKGLLDMLEINHREKYLQPDDLKCTYAVEDFYNEYYIKRKGYLQVAMYDLACTHLRNRDYPGYEIRPLRFIVCDNINYYSPLVYELSLQDLSDAFKGFTHRGKRHKGLIELVRELNWHIDNNVWNMSMDNYLRDGVVPLSLYKQP